MNINIKNTISIFAATLLLSACGSTNSGSNDGTSSTKLGAAFDGYVTDANVTLSKNNQYLATTTTGGEWNTTKAIDEGAILEFKGGTDEATGEAFEGVLKAVYSTGDYIIATPLTSVIAAMMENNSSLSVTEATDAFADALDLNDSDLLTSDLYLASEIGTEAEQATANTLIKKALQIQKMAEIFASDTNGTIINDDFEEVMRKVAKSIFDTNTTDANTTADAIESNTPNSALAKSLATLIEDANITADSFNSVSKAIEIVGALAESNITADTLDTLNIDDIVDTIDEEEEKDAAYTVDVSDALDKISDDNTTKEAVEAAIVAALRAKTEAEAATQTATAAKVVKAATAAKAAATTAVTSAEATLKKAQAAVTAAQAALDALEESDSDAYIAAYAALTKAQAALTTAQTAYDAALAKVTTTTDAQTKAQTAYDAALAKAAAVKANLLNLAVEEAQAAYDAAEELSTDSKTASNTAALSVDTLAGAIASKAAADTYLTNATAVVSLAQALDAANLANGTTTTLADSAALEVEAATTAVSVATAAIAAIEASTEDGAICDDNNPLTENDIYTGGICAGTDIVPESETISADGTTTASDALSEIYTISSNTSYTHTITDFDPAMDKLDFGTDITSSSLNIEYPEDDGEVTLTYHNTNTDGFVTLILDGLTSAEDELLSIPSTLDTVLNNQ